METKEWKELKSLISSLLISTPLQLTVRMLHKDYQNEVGYCIPYQKFGFVTLEQCLDNMSDILQRNGSYISVCVSSKSAHIDKLIARQVIPTSKRPTSRAPPIRHQRRHIVPNYESYNTTGRRWNERAFTKTIPPLIPTSGIWMTPPTKFLQTPQPSRKYTSFNPAPKTPRPYSVSSNARNIHNAISKSTAENINLKTAKSEPQLLLVKVNEHEHIAMRVNIDRSMVNTQVPLEVQKDLIHLIDRFDEGLWCTNLPEAYRELFKKELDYTKYGFKSLILMCIQLDNIFYCYRPNKGDFMLYDRKKPLPDTLDIDFVQPSDASRKPTPVEAVLTTKPRSLYPLNVLHLFDVIPKQFTQRKIKKNDFIEVCLGDVYSPEVFFVVLTKFSEELNKLMDYMQIFYSKRAHEYKIPESMIAKNLYCVIIYDKEYHRARIIDVLPQQTRSIKVFCFDYGTVYFVKPSELYYLHKRFVSLPQQAIEARLAGIKACDVNDKWSREAAVELLNLTRDEHLYAHIFHVDQVQQRLDIFLVDTNGNTDIHVNDVLVNKGYALFTHEDVTAKLAGKLEEVHIKNIQQSSRRKELLKSLTRLYCKNGP